MNATKSTEISVTGSPIIYYENSQSSLSNETLYYIIIGASIMTLIVCSFVCCLLIYTIITLKNTTKEIVKQRRPKSPHKLKSQSVEGNQRKNKSLKRKATTDEIPHFQNPASDSCSNSVRGDKIGIHDRMISNDWKLTINDLHRLTISQQYGAGQIPLCPSDTNQPSTSPIPVPITPIPNEIDIDNISIEIDKNNNGKSKSSKFNMDETEQQHRNRINDVTMIEKSISDQSDQPWKYFSKYFEHSGNGRCKELFDEIDREKDESEELEVVVENDNESTVTKTIDINENINGNLINMNDIDKLSIVNNINTMTNIGGIDEFTLESIMPSITTGDDGEMMIKTYGPSSKSNTLFMSSMNRQPTCPITEFSEEFVGEIEPIIDNTNNNQQNNQQKKGLYV